MGDMGTHAEWEAEPRHPKFETIGEREARMKETVEIVHAPGVPDLKITTRRKQDMPDLANPPAQQPVFHPMPGRIVVDLITEDEIGGIIIPLQYQKVRVLGTIRAIGGDEEEGEFYDLKVGDVVVFSQNSGIKVEVDRTQVVFLRTSEILATITWETLDAEDA